MKINPDRLRKITNAAKETAELSELRAIISFSARDGMAEVHLDHEYFTDTFPKYERRYFSENFDEIFRIKDNVKIFALEGRHD